MPSTCANGSIQQHHFKSWSPSGAYRLASSIIGMASAQHLRVAKRHGRLVHAVYTDQADVVVSTHRTVSAQLVAVEHMSSNMTIFLNVFNCKSAHDRWLMTAYRKWFGVSGFSCFAYNKFPRQSAFQDGNTTAPIFYDSSWKWCSGKIGEWRTYLRLKTSD